MSCILCVTSTSASDVFPPSRSLFRTAGIVSSTNGSARTLGVLDANGREERVRVKGERTHCFPSVDGAVSTSSTSVDIQNVASSPDVPHLRLALISVIT